MATIAATFRFSFSMRLMLAALGKPGVVCLIPHELSWKEIPVGSSFPRLHSPPPPVFMRHSASINLAILTLATTKTKMEHFSLKEDKTMIFLICTLAVIVVILYPRWQRHAKNRAMKQKYGCKDPAKYRHEDKVWGSDMVRSRAQAMKEGSFLSYMRPSLKNMARHRKKSGGASH